MINPIKMIVTREQLKGSYSEGEALVFDQSYRRGTLLAATHAA